MNTHQLAMLRTLALMGKDELSKLNIKGRDIHDVTRKVTYRDQKGVETDFLVDLKFAMRHHRDPEWKGYLVAPSTCDNPSCPFHTGRTFVYVFDYKGWGKTEWMWDAPDGEGVDSGCGDHSWLTDDMKVEVK